jgi:glycosyltransferase involved in cell wall biosynthesis
MTIPARSVFGALSGTPCPVVSVVIPARNEELNLPACLDSILRQNQISFETIVVDDNSTDRTARIAAAYGSVRVVNPGPLPSGWSGKSYAISQAIPYARGTWLLFTDADTVHSPTSIEVGVNEAVSSKADLLSYSPYQLLGSLWEKLLQPLVFAELNAKFKYDNINDPSSTSAAANGQYILISRDAYSKIGGHERVRGELLEDVAIAKAVKQAGGKIRFRYAPEVVAARMYRNLGQIWEGWTKNLANLFPSVLALGLLRLLEFLVFFAGMVLLAISAYHHSARIALEGILALLCPFAFMRNRFKKAGFSFSSTIISIPALPVLFALMVNSFIRTKLLKRSVWKGRTYSLNGLL